MMKSFRLALPLAFLLALPAAAQDWSIGGATGAFVFGDFAERTLVASVPGETITSHITLSAETRPGLQVDLERSLGDRWAFRLEGTFTRAPLAVEDESGEGIPLDVGEMDVTTFMIPIIFRINPRGAFRFHLHAGPAYAMYRVDRELPVGVAIAPFEGTRSRFGAAAGGGVAWWVSDRFAIEGQVTYIRTASPFEREDFGSAANNINIPHSQHFHTTVGARLRF